MGLAQATEDFRFGSLRLRLSKGGVEEQDEAMDLFGGEDDALEVGMLGECRDIVQPAIVTPVVDSAAEAEGLEQLKDALSVSAQLNLKALINFYLPLRGL